MREIRPSGLEGGVGSNIPIPTPITSRPPRPIVFRRSNPSRRIIDATARLPTVLPTAMALRFLALFLCTLASSLHAVEYSTVEHLGKKFTVCRVNVRKEHLQLFHRDENGQPFKRFERLAKWLEPKKQQLVFAMNAGMYHGDFSAVGLFVADGKQVVPLNPGNAPADEPRANFFLKPNGVFALTEAGARVVETSEYPKLGDKVTLATQSGPLLLRAGKLHPAFQDSSANRLFRNGVGVPGPDTAIFVISDEPVNFHELATLFRDKLACPDALFLDGTVSSLRAPALKRSDFRMDLGPILGVTE
jgi:uncharacterized protein YigE (DUF2233 family)